MPNSANVNAGDTILATQYNNLRTDVLAGHDHITAGEGAALGTGAVSGDIIADEGIGADKLGDGATFKNTQERIFTITPSDMICNDEAGPYDIGANPHSLRNGDTSSISYYAGVHLPHAAIVTSIRVYWYRDDALASGDALLARHDFSGGTPDTMGDADSDATTGYHSVIDSSIDNATIDNTSYTYFLRLILDPNDNADDVAFMGAVIRYTVQKPLP